MTFSNGFQCPEMNSKRCFNIVLFREVHRVLPKAHCTLCKKGGKRPASRFPGNSPLIRRGATEQRGCQCVAEGLRPVGYGMARPLWIMNPGGRFAPPPPWALFYVTAVFMPQCAPQCVHCTEGTTCHLAGPYPSVPFVNGR